MSDDIVARLRAADEWMLVGLEGLAFHNDAPFDAADEIERLRAERDALRALLLRWDALINHQFNGSREAMSAMTECAQMTAQELYGDPPWPTRIDAALKGDRDE